MTGNLPVGSRSIASENECSFSLGRRKDRLVANKGNRFSGDRSAFNPYYLDFNTESFDMKELADLSRKNNSAAEIVA